MTTKGHNLNSATLPPALFRLDWSLVTYNDRIDVYDRYLMIFNCSLSALFLIKIYCIILETTQASKLSLLFYI